MRLLTILAFAPILVDVSCDDSSQDITARWMELEKKLQNILERYSKSAFREFMPTLLELEVSAECLGSLVRLHTGIQDLDTQFFRLVDASGKLASGFIQGTMTDFGNFDQCLQSVIVLESGETLFEGKYCLGELRLPLPEKPMRIPSGGVIDRKNFRQGSMFEHFANHSSILYWMAFRQGICVPSTCSDDDITKIYSKFASEATLEGTVLKCQKKAQDAPFNQIQLTAILCLTLIAAPPLSITAIKVVYSFCDKRVPKILENIQTLSIDHTLGKVFSDKRRIGDLNCVHGLRVCSLLWLIVSHSYAYLDVNSLSNATKIQKALGTWLFQPIANGWLVVDSFFCVSGFLVTYTLNKTKLSWKVIFTKWILRYWRLVPLALAVLSFQFFFALLFDGPLMPLLNDPMTRNCARTWWHTLVANYQIEDETSCLPHLWYVGVELKLFTIQLPLSIVLMKKPLIGVLLHFCAIALSGGYCAITSMIYDMPPVNPLGQDRMLAIEVAQRVYFHWLTHLASYSIGSLAAFFALQQVHSDCHNKHRLRKVSQLFLWLLTFTTGSIALMSGRVWTIMETKQVISVIIAGLQRPFWSTTVGWIIFACVSGYGNCLNRLFSLKQWVPLSRLSYAIYLCHPYILYANTRAAHERKEATHFSILRDACAVLVFSTLLAALITVLIEAPIVATQKWLINIRAGKRAARPSATL